MKKVAKGFVKFYLGLIITTMAMWITMDRSQGGFGVNAVLAFALWLAMMFILIRVSTLGGLASAIIIYLISMYMAEGATEAFSYMLAASVLLMTVVLYIRHQVEVRLRVREKHRQDQSCCPYCASTRIHFVQGDTEISSKPEWTFDFLDKRYHRDNVIRSKHNEGYWQCDCCGKKFRH